MKLTRKQKAFADHLINNPKSSATEAAAQAYDIKGKRHTAEVIASDNLRKPEIVSYLSRHSDNIESVLINTVNDYKDSHEVKERGLAINTAMYIHDKIHGKATQRIDSHSTVVEIKLDLGDIT
jgi:phage terminase small subunit